MSIASPNPSLQQTRWFSEGAISALVRSIRGVKNGRTKRSSRTAEEYLAMNQALRCGSRLPNR
jgi:hypothetical protein